MKKLMALVCAAALVLALPVCAWAAPSPSAPQESVTVGDGVTATVTFPGEVTVTPSETQASNVQLSATEQVMGSIEVNAEGVSESNPLTLTFTVGTQYAGYTGKIFVQHNDGTTEVFNVTVNSDGTVSLTVTKLSIFTLAIDTASAPASSTGTGSADSSAVSPKTGVDSAALAGGIAVMAVAAGGAAFALRKKIAE